MEVLRCAISYGADAVYIGGEAFGLRARAQNFTDAQLEEAIAYAHARGVKVHITANILAHDSDIKEAAAYFRLLETLRPDAVLVADPGMFLLAREHCPSVPLHISTQANNTNAATFRFWHDQKAARVVCARELSVEEIRDIRANTPEELEIEAFVHGAMCISYSGRCLLSAYLAGRDANRGNCAHPCRWQYALVEEKRPGEYLPVEENERGTFIMGSRDLCMIEHLPKLWEAGVDSFKIEGRMKTPLYVGTITRAYRRAIDDFIEDPARYQANLPRYREEIRRCTYREFTEGFYFGRPSEKALVTSDNAYSAEAVFIGLVEAVEGDYALFTQKNKFSVGETVEILKPEGDDVETVVEEILDEEGRPQESAPHPAQALRVRFGTTPMPGDLIRQNRPKSV